MLGLGSFTYYHGNSLTNHHGHKVIARHSLVFLIICSHSRVFANSRNMFLKFVRKAYSQHICKQLQAILIDGNAFFCDSKTFVKVCKHSYGHFRRIQDKCGQ